MTSVLTADRSEVEEGGVVNIDTLQGAESAEVFARLEVDQQGLSDGEASARLARFGPNALEQHKTSLLQEVLHYFWGPIPWMIEIAAVLSAAMGDWMDFAIVTALLVINAGIGFTEEHKAADAMAALRSQLAPKARALRSGQWSDVDASQLVPGDIVKLRLGDIVPADIYLFGNGYLSIDQSALTGESLPVSKQASDISYSGTVVKQGEMTGAVASTGSNTYLGRTAHLVASAGAKSHFQEAVMRIGKFLIYTAIALSALLIGVELARGASFVHLLQFVLILVVASIPVAMPAVLSVTMALGAVALSKHKAIVTHLESIEEMAGIDVLCSDKTGTLTQNKLTVGDALCLGAADNVSVLRAAALASSAENNDVIDSAVISALEVAGGSTNGYSVDDFVPFDPVSKRTEARVLSPEGRTYRVSKGAPQVIIDLCKMPEVDRGRASELVATLAAKGYRALGVAEAGREGEWRFLGILPLSDPPREDSLETVREAQANGIDVKMVTGDNRAIAKEISGALGMGTDIQVASALFDRDGQAMGDVGALAEKAGGYAEVFPEHKYNIVKALQQRGHLVGMTGDGVNDAAALKQADVGIAVSGATGAAQVAADLVLTKPGLSVITHAVEEARRIFERMSSYAVYRIAMTIDIMAFVVAAMLFYDKYPLTAVMIVLLALLDDIPIMTIAYDHTYLSEKPVRWDMRRTLSVATWLGGFSVVETFIMLFLGHHFGLTYAERQTVVFLQLVVGGHLMLFLTRARKSFWQRPFPSRVLFSAIVATQVLAVLLAGFGLLVPKIPWAWVGVVWAYNIVWMVVLDGLKLVVDWRLERRRLGSTDTVPGAAEKGGLASPGSAVFSTDSRRLVASGWEGPVRVTTAVPASSGDVTARVAGAAGGPKDGGVPVLEAEGVESA
ncbi:MAG: plasma-membrane proton-efflux P-type ATPase [Acidimicrobiales bacterium]